jgi:anti-sigma regulatory factor (Ser/Thr protein kinase)
LIVQRPGAREAPSIVVDFEHELSACRLARRALTPLLADLDAELADSVLLVTSELVANVVQHTDEGGTLRLWPPHREQPLLLEVSDAVPQMLVPRPARRSSDINGRGLQIVADLSASWGVTVQEAGKTVWAEFA